MLCRLINITELLAHRFIPIPIAAQGICSTTSLSHKVGAITEVVGTSLEFNRVPDEEGERDGSTFCVPQVDTRVLVDSLDMQVQVTGFDEQENKATVRISGTFNPLDKTGTPLPEAISVHGELTAATKVEKL